MKVALIQSGSLQGGGERRVAELARGLRGRQVDADVLTFDRRRRVVGLQRSDGRAQRRSVAAALASSRGHLSPGLMERLADGAYDLADAHTSELPVSLAAARAGVRRVVFTPNAPIQQLLRWPSRRATQSAVARAIRVVCASAVQAELLCRSFSWAADRVRVVPPGVDMQALDAATPLPSEAGVVVASGRLERINRVDRAIAAMASLEPVSRLVVIGDGHARRGLRAYAADLRVSSRVAFAGALRDSDRYSWLRTARVAVALAEEHESGLPVLEALAAGVPVVASDIPVHREAASYAGEEGVVFVSPEGSPLEVADAIHEAERADVPAEARMQIPSWDSVVERTLTVYEGLLPAEPPEPPEAGPIPALRLAGAAHTPGPGWRDGHA